jgi:Tfp pilus assembly protein PilF
MEQNEAQQAESLLKKAIYLNHKHVLSHFMLADIALKNDKKQISKKHYETVIELLEEYQDNDIISDSEGLTAESLKALAASFINSK